jgi:hypothetical protein
MHQFYSVHIYEMLNSIKYTNTSEYLFIVYFPSSQSRGTKVDKEANVLNSAWNIVRSLYNSRHEDNTGKPRQQTAPNILPIKTLQELIFHRIMVKNFSKQYQNND